MSRNSTIRLGRKFQRRQVLTDSCVITTVTIGTDAGGAQTETTATATELCAFWEVGGDEESGDALKERGKYRLAVGLTAVIDGTSRVTFSGRPYRVVWTPPPTARSTRRIVGLEEA